MRDGRPNRSGEEINPFDFLIAGAGSAGCIVARVLAEAGYRVAVIEADAPAPPHRRPADYVRTFSTDQDWRLKTIPQTGLVRRQLLQPRGRGPGGSTRINAMIWYPPGDDDLQNLEVQSGGKLCQSSLRSSLATVTSWVKPQPPRWISEATRRYLRTSTPAIDPPHAYLRMGNRGGRVTAFDVLNDGKFRGGNVELITASVSRVVFDGQRAIGLEVRYYGEVAPKVIAAGKGVILCGGTFASPVILMQSGIGPAGKLAELRIDTRVDSPDVGNHLADHLIMPVIFGVSSRWRFPPQPTVADLARWQIASTGPLASNLAESGGTYRLPMGATHLPIGATHLVSQAAEAFQVHVTPTHYLTHPSQTSVAAMTIGVNLCQPKSRGSVTLEPTDKWVPPTNFTGGLAIRIDPGYLTVRGDVDSLITAVRHARVIASDPELQTFLNEELVPGLDRQSDEAIQRAISRFSQTLYHPVGTCRLGADPTSVVDSSAAVRGAEQLYVIDGSILPTITSVNPNAFIMMLAHHLACQLID